jgi:hypothetical protein
VEQDTEGVVAKLASAPYAMIGDRSPWTKIKFAGYSQARSARAVRAIATLTAWPEPIDGCSQAIDKACMGAVDIMVVVTIVIAAQWWEMRDL